MYVRKIVNFLCIYRRRLHRTPWAIVDRRLAETFVEPRRIRVLTSDASSHRVVAPYLGDLCESLVDENKRDEDGKTFLSKSRDVSDEGAEVKGNDDEQRHHDPEADPESECHEVDVIITGKYDSSYIGH